MEAHEKRSGAAAAITCTTLTLITESYIEGMTEPLIIWITLRESVRVIKG